MLHNNRRYSNMQIIWNLMHLSYISMISLSNWLYMHTLNAYQIQQVNPICMYVRYGLYWIISYWRQTRVVLYHKLLFTFYQYSLTQTTTRAHVKCIGSCLVFVMTLKFKSIGNKTTTQAHISHFVENNE